MVRMAPKRAKKKVELTIISRRVSRLTLNGIFLITIAVGMTSSSGLMAPGVSAPTGGLR